TRTTLQPVSSAWKTIRSMVPSSVVDGADRSGPERRVSSQGSEAPPRRWIPPGGCWRAVMEQGAGPRASIAVSRRAARPHVGRRPLEIEDRTVAVGARAVRVDPLELVEEPARALAILEDAQREGPERILLRQLHQQHLRRSAHHRQGLAQLVG